MLSILPLVVLYYSSILPLVLAVFSRLIAQQTAAALRRRPRASAASRQHLAGCNSNGIAFFQESHFDFGFNGLSLHVPTSRLILISSETQSGVQKVKCPRQEGYRVLAIDAVKRTEVVNLVAADAQDND